VRHCAIIMKSGCIELHSAMVCSWETARGLCCVVVRLVNKLIPGYVKKINTKGGNFALMENIAAVQKGMRQYGVPEDELFQPVDLFEARNIKAVVKSLAALARTVGLCHYYCYKPSRPFGP